MTIISTVFVPEGIAISADSRLTYHVDRNGRLEIFPLTDNAQKIVLLRGESVGVAFCGNAIIEGKTISDYLRVFDIEEVELEDSVSEIANKLKSYLGKNLGTVAFFITGYDNDEPQVYEVGETVIRKNITEEGNLYNGCAWHGEQEAINRLLLSEPNTPFNFDFMPLKDAVDLAEFLVKLTIDYYRFADILPTCGGDIDLLVITKDFTKFIKHKIL